LKIRLGIPVVIPFAPYLERQQRMAASETLPQAVLWTSLGRGEGWELALTLGDDESPILLVAGDEAQGDSGLIFECDGERVSATLTPEGSICQARAGQWVVRIGESRLEFEVSG